MMPMRQPRLSDYPYAAGRQFAPVSNFGKAHASHMVMSGMPLATVKEILRHKDYAMTLRYAHLSSDHKKAAIDALEKSLAIKSKEEEKTA
jgi:site-specific recombinase XerD